MAASYDKDGDVELNCELSQGRNLNYLSLSKKKGKLTLLTWVLFGIILGLLGIIMYLATAVSNLKNEECNLSERATTTRPTQTTISGPKDTEVINVEISSCGGIINVEMNRTTKIKFGHVVDNFEEISCTWIIKSDAKMVNLQWSNTGVIKFPRDELLIGELSLADEELHCRNIEAQGNRITNIVTTPAILHFTSTFHIDPLNFEVKLIPVTSGGTHKSQPQTYYVNKKPAGSLGIPNERPDSLLGMVTVFENNDDRQLKCSDLTRAGQCCESVEAYNIGSEYGRTSCAKVPVSNLTTQMSSYGTVVLLAPTHGLCQFSWKEA